MPCELRIRDDLSLEKIENLARTHDVKVTPHVGNWTPARLVLPTLELSILCVDHTIGNRDVNAHPHLVIKGGKQHVICDHADRLTTHARVTEPTYNGHGVGTPLSNVHVGALRSLFPGATIVTHSEHLRAHRDITLAVLEETTKLSRSLVWWRRVDEGGIVTHFKKKELPRVWDDYAPAIFPLTNEKEGWLVHNRISILMDVILQSRMGNEAEIYHLSGPDMIRYLGGEMEAISRMYDYVRSRLGLRQPAITINLVPFASFRFATRASQADACEKLCEALEDSCMPHIRARCTGVEDVFAETETQSYFTQHDCLESGETVVVPEIARTWSLAKCAEHLATMKGL